MLCVYIYVSGSNYECLYTCILVLRVETKEAMGMELGKLQLILIIIVIVIVITRVWI